MDKTLKRTILLLSGGFVLLLLLFVINQLIQISIITSAIHPVLGKTVTILLSLLFVALFVLPFIGFFNLKKPIALPDKTDEAACKLYLFEVKQRLIKNEYLLKNNYVFNENKETALQINDALKVLNQEAEKVMNEAASVVFITTAVSQNGVLDSFFVLSSLTKLVWKVSHIYNQRPNVKEIFYLYANVAATVLMARQIEDLTLLDEQLEPIIDSLIGGALSTMVPGITSVANLILNSIIEGSANAFLTLRVGAITKQYSAAVTKTDKSIIKKYATLEAGALFGKIVHKNSVSIVKAFSSATKKATIDKSLEKMKENAEKTGRLMKKIFKT